MAYNKKTKMWEGYIYKIINNVNDIVYIGQTITTLHQRFLQHKSMAKRNNTSYKICNAIYSIGDQHFSIIELEKYEDNDRKNVLDKLNILERYYIKQYKENGYELYNMTNGGQNCVGENSKKSVIQYNLFCEKINEYESIVVASNYTGIVETKISACCLRKCNRAGYYIWRYKNDPINDSDIEYYSKKYPGICQYDLKGNLLDTYSNYTEAFDILRSKYEIKKPSISNLYNRCEGKGAEAYGFIWRYKKDKFDKYPLPDICRYVEKRNIITGELIQTYYNYIDASNKNNTNKRGILASCKNRIKSSNGYIWCFKGEDYMSRLEKHDNGHNKGINMYSLNKEYITHFNSIKEAGETLNISTSLISAACLNKINTAGGYIWRFDNDDINNYIGRTNYLLCNKNHPISVYDKNYNYIGDFYSKQSIYRFLGIKNGEHAIFNAIINKSLYKDCYYEQHND